MLRRNHEDGFEFLLVEQALRRLAPEGLTLERKIALHDRIFSQLGAQDVPWSDAARGLVRTKWVAVPVGVGLAAAIISALHEADRFTSGTGTEIQQAAPEFEVSGVLDRGVARGKLVQARTPAWITHAGAVFGLEAGSSMLIHTTGSSYQVELIDGELLVTTDSAPVTIRMGAANATVAPGGSGRFLLAGDVYAVEALVGGVSVMAAGGLTYPVPAGTGPIFFDRAGNSLPGSDRGTHAGGRPGQATTAQGGLPPSSNVSGTPSNAPDSAHAAPPGLAAVDDAPGGPAGGNAPVADGVEPGAPAEAGHPSQAGTPSNANTGTPGAGFSDGGPGAAPPEHPLGEPPGQSGGGPEHPQGEPPGQSGEQPEHPQGGPPGQSGEEPVHPQGGPPGQSGEQPVHPQGGPPGQSGGEESSHPLGGPPGQSDVGPEHPQGGPPGQSGGEESSHPLGGPPGQSDAGPEHPQGAPPGQAVGAEPGHPLGGPPGQAGGDNPGNANGHGNGKGPKN